MQARSASCKASAPDPGSLPGQVQTLVRSSALSFPLPRGRRMPERKARKADVPHYSRFVTNRRVHSLLGDKSKPVYRVSHMPNRILLLALLWALGPHSSGSLRAQVPPGASLTITPSLGFAAIGDNGHLASGGMIAMVEMDLNRPPFRWSTYLATRGVGIGCSDGCDLGGQSIGVGVSYVLGPVGLGGGMGLLHRSAGWLVQPHGQISASRGILRLQLRVEVPEGLDDIHVPLLLGLQIPVR
jgi:hypothetical protein